MFENIAKFFKKLVKTENKNAPSKDTAKERLHLVLMQDRANVSADFMELMKQEIIDVIKKYIDVDEAAIDVRLTNEIGEDGTKGAPALYANIPIKNIKNGIKAEEKSKKDEDDKPKEEIKKEEPPKEDKESEELVEVEKQEEKDVASEEEVKEEEQEEKKEEEVKENETEEGKEETAEEVEEEKTEEENEDDKKEEVKEEN